MTEPTTHPTPSTQALQNAVLAMPMARTLGLRFVRAEPGATELEMPIADALCFQPGQLQATAIFALGDFAAVSAAGSLLPAGWANATVDGSVKLFAPARGTHLRARGRVVDAGRVLSICAADDLQLRHKEVVKIDFDLGTRQEVLDPAHLYS